jgi:membrane-associated protein
MARDNLLHSKARFFATAVVLFVAALVLPSVALAGGFADGTSSLPVGSIISVASSIGYPLLFLIVLLETGCGIPFAPGELALATAGIAAADHKLSIVWVIVVGAAGAIVGDNIGYVIGRAGGRRVLESPKGPFHRQRQSMIRLGDPFFERHGPKAVFFGRWLPVLRVFASWLAGGNKMRWWPTFVFWNAAGGICWAASVSALGYFGGGVAKTVLDKVGLYGLIFVAAGIVTGFLLYRRHNRRVLAELEVEAQPTVNQVAAIAPEPPS